MNNDDNNGYDEYLQLMTHAIVSDTIGPMPWITRVEWDEMPKLDMIYKDPDAVKMPKEPKVMYGVSMWIASTLTKDNFAIAYKYIKRMPMEFQILVVRTAYRREASIAGAGKEFNEWININSKTITKLGD